MMTNNRQNKLALHCWAHVAGMFATFHNQRFRGTNFEWDTFPEIASASGASIVYSMTNAKEHEREFIV